MKALLVIFVLSLIFISCDKEGDSSKIKADFTFEVGSDENHIVFHNESSGNYYAMYWNFGNGETSSTTDKSKSYEIYYPLAGEYDITLKIEDESGNSSESIQTIAVASDDPYYEEPDDLIWSDEFDGSSINMNNWTFETGAGGWGNNELQNYTNGDNAHISDGKLIITARKVNNNQVAGSYTSTRMVTLGKQEFTYGRMEVRAKLPSGTGIWPAIWMLGSNINSVGWPACGELDIMEYVGYEPNTIHATVHTPAGHAGDGEGSSKTLNTAEEEFHIYGMIWDENAITFYTDSPENITHVYSPAIKTVNNWPFDQSQFFILNIAVGGNWGGAQGIDNNIFPQTMEVDYVRVYALDEN